MQKEGKGKEASQIVQEAWKGYSDKQKQPYEKKAEQSRERYEKQVAELAKKGFYTLEDGTKSTDEIN